MAEPAPATGNQILIDALTSGGVIGIDESIEQSILSKAQTIINRMIAQWNRKRFIVYHLVDYAKVSTGALSYNVGKGLDFNINPRPDRIESAFLRLINNATPPAQFVDLPLMIIPSMENYNQIPLKSIGTLPDRVFYDSGWPTGVLKPIPVPQASLYEIHITVKETLQRLSDLTQPITLPPEYEAAIEWCGARRLRAGFQMPPDATVNELAADALNTIRLANVQIPTLSLPDELRRNNGQYNYRSDSNY